MKKFILGLSVLFALGACEVVHPHDAPTLNKQNISEFCDGVFKDIIHAGIVSFYDVYYVGRFIEASPEEQVSSKYDEIRTRLRKSTSSYTYKDKIITFSKESPFTVGSIWTVSPNYRRKETITMRSENEWKLESWNDMTMIITLLSADDTGMKLNVEIRGEWTEESSYSAEYISDGIDIEIVNKNPIAMGTSHYSGPLEFYFYKNSSMILQCNMTLRSGAPSIYDIHE
jgi:hypothetical protein